MSYGHRSGHQIKPVMSHGFLTGRFYVHRYRFGLTKLSKFIPIAISTCTCVGMPLWRARQAYARILCAESSYTRPWPWFSSDFVAHGHLKTNNYVYSYRNRDISFDVHFNISFFYLHCHIIRDQHLELLKNPKCIIRPCLVPKNFKISRHIESCDKYIKY
jgi:hypothetical protein